MLVALLAVPASAQLSVFAQPPATSDQFLRAFFEVVLNGRNLGDMLVLLAPPDVWVPAKALESAGLEMAGTRREVGGQTFVSLQSLAPDLTYEIDEPALVLKITAASQLFGLKIITVGESRPPDFEYRATPVVFFNYGVNYRGSTTSDAAAELGAHVGGVFVSTTASTVSKGQVVRGLSQAIVDDRRRMRRFTIGDRFVSSGVLGGGALIGGVTVSKDFGLDPYFVRYPTLDFSGAVTTPSTVEVYVNDRLVHRTQIAPGQLELRRIPVPNGTGDTRLIVRDAFGRTSEVSTPFYLTTALLAPGVHDYTYSFGWVRRPDGPLNWNYGDPLFMATHRVGITNTLSVGLRAEAGRHLINGGPLLNAQLWRLGEAELAFARSRTNDLYGSAASAGYRYQGRVFSIGSVGRYATPLYAAASRGPFDPRARYETSSFVGLRLGSLASITALHDTRRNYPHPLTESKRTRTLLTISSRLSQWLFLFVSGGRTRTDGVNFREATISLSVPLGNRRIVSVSAEDGSFGRRTAIDIQQSEPIGEGLGYRFRGETKPHARTDSKVTYNTRYARLEADHQYVDSIHTRTLSVAAGLVFTDRRLFASRPIDQSFAVIKVPGVKGVRGFLSNQEVGRTGRGGYLLVPNVLPYYGNVLSISDQDVPFDYALDKTRRVVAPPFRGGAVVTFSAEKRQAVSGTLAIESRGETVVPAYGQLILVVAGETVESPIGQRGEFYLEGVPGGTYSARIMYRGESCQFELEVPASTAPVVPVGLVRCQVR